ncbi:MAG: helix-turn-helix domain-containing protein [Deltaproteobacteria bacterium]|nr:helix-turn-helix domain-containing protein [Deltaproteobacteria bacterium]
MTRRPRSPSTSLRRVVAATTSSNPLLSIVLSPAFFISDLRSDQCGQRRSTRHDGFVNQPPSIVDPSDEGLALREWITTAEAARLLGVKRETLYAYTSRGLVRSAPTAGSRERVYHREDVERLRTRSLARSGHAAVAASALRWGEPVLETRVGAIDAGGPRYRGKSAVEMAKQGSSFEEVCGLLWEGSFVLGPELAQRRLGASLAHLRGLLRAGGEPFDGMLVTAAALAASEPRAEPTVEMARVRAPVLLRRLVAACGLPRGADAVNGAIEAETVARAVLVALGGRTTNDRVAAMNEALVVSADHELNASTFAARIAASSAASLPACAMAALGALSGPLHGALTARVEALVTEIGKPERAAVVVGERLSRGESVPGFGHPLYPEGDPRGALLMEVAQRIGAKTPRVRVLVAAANAMQLVARERPTLDLGLVALAAALGLPKGAALAIFACGRIAGWVAHVLEQREAGFLLRPRARYVGP